MTKRISLVVFALMVATGSLVTQVRTQAQTPDTAVLDFFKAYDAAFNARDIVKLATMYHKDVTIFEGAGINNGWADYRDNHLGPELKSFQDLQWAHANIVVHALGATAAYVTADYTIKYKVGDRAVDSGGIATHVLVKEDGQWKIRHSMTAARRRAPGVNTAAVQGTEFSGTVAAVETARVQVKTMAGDGNPTGKIEWFAVTDNTQVTRAGAAVRFGDARIKPDERIVIVVAHGGEAGVEWTCAMHPEVAKAEAGKCPICGMTLKERARAAIASAIRLLAS